MWFDTPLLDDLDDELKGYCSCQYICCGCKLHCKSYTKL